MTQDSSQPVLGRVSTVLLPSATSGAGGTRLSQAAWLPVFRTLGMCPWFGKILHVAGAGQVFEGEGEKLHLKDEKLRQLVKDYMAGFAASLKG